MAWNYSTPNSNTAKRLEKSSFSNKEPKPPEDSQLETNAATQGPLEQVDERAKIAAYGLLANFSLLEASTRIDKLESKIDTFNQTLAGKPSQKDLDAIKENSDGKFLSLRSMLPVTTVLLVVVIPLLVYVFHDSKSQLNKEIAELKSQIKLLEASSKKIPTEPEIRFIARDEAERANKALNRTP